MEAQFQKYIEEFNFREKHLKLKKEIEIQTKLIEEMRRKYNNNVQERTYKKLTKMYFEDDNDNIIEFDPD